MKKNNFLTLKVAKELNMDSLCLSKGDKIKAVFIVSQTNYHGEFDLYFNKFKKLMGLNSVQLNTIINTLVEANIIKKLKAGKYKEDSATYTMVKPFNVDTDDCDVVSFQYEAPGTPTFINRFIADGFTYKNYSSYQPRKEAVKETPELKALKDRINQLENFIQDNGLKVPALPEKEVKPVSIKQVNPIVQPEVKSAPVLKNIQPNEVMVVPINPEPIIEESGIEMLSNGLVVCRTDDMMAVQGADKSCVVMNYADAMAGWADRLDISTKSRLFNTILTAPNGRFNFFLNKHTKADFTKKLDSDSNVEVYCGGVAAA